MKNFLKFKTGQGSLETRKFGEEYYLNEAKLWKPFRLFGLFATLAAIIFAVSAIFSSHWLDGKGFSGGIWRVCYQNLSDAEALHFCPDKRPQWQNAVIGLMIFAASLGLFASVLAVFGVCTIHLPRKMYYFHSAGEIFIVCALSIGIALVIFPVAIALDEHIFDYRFGIGYGLSWGAAFFFVAAALCNSLDDVVNQITRTKCCRWYLRNSHNELRHV